MRRLMHPLLGIYAYVTFALLLLIFLPLVALAWLFHRGDPAHRIQGRWVRRLGKACGGFLNPFWSFSVEGAPPEGIDSKGYVVVSNHESSADVFLLSRLPWDMRWVAKEELFHVPVAGWILRLGGDIPVRRGRGGSVRAMIAACKTTLANGLSVMIFPEGTRSDDGELLPFRDGAFELAIEAGVPVLPIAVSGARACRPKGSLWFGFAHARARILPAISTEGLGPEDIASLRDGVRSRIAAAVAELRESGAVGPRPGLGGPSRTGSVV